MTDLSNFEVEAASDIGSEVTILHPVSEQPLDISIKVAGPDSRRAREAVRSMTDRLTKEAVEKKLSPDDATFERMAAMHVAAITLGWTGIELNGEEFSFTPENAIKLYTEHRWIRIQVEGFAAQRANFFKK